MGAAETPNILSYAGPNSLIAPHRMYASALWFASVPMFVGLGALIGFALSGWDVFALIGLMTLFLGNISVLTAVVLLVIYAHRSKHDANVPPDIRRHRIGNVIGLMIANYPLALICFAAGMALMEYRHSSF